MTRQVSSKNSFSHSDKAYWNLKRKIITLEMEPGAEINEAALTRVFGLGRTPIREALFRLLSEDLLEMRPGRGFFVKHITFKDAKDIFDTLLLLDKIAITSAVNFLTADEINELSQINGTLKGAWQNREYLKVALLNSDFHRLIYNSVNNSFLCSYLNNMQNHLDRLTYMSVSENNDRLRCHFWQSIKEHKEIIEAFREKNVARALEVNIQHIKNFHRTIVGFGDISKNEINFYTRGNGESAVLKEDLFSDEKEAGYLE